MNTPTVVINNLADELKVRQKAVETGRDQTQVNIMRTSTEQLIKQGIDQSALRVDDEIPLFDLLNVHGQSIAIADLLKQGPIVLTFYRGSWCPYCNLELRAYQRSLADIKKQGGQVVAVSPELPDSSLSNAEKMSLEFEVLSDIGNKVAYQFGLVFTMPDDLIEVYKQLGSDITGYTGDDSWQLPIPATYLVTPNRRIIFSYINIDYLQRANLQEIIEVLATL